MLNNSNSEKGFSLLELLFTMSLAVILSAMVSQSYSLYKQKAQHSSAIVLFNEARASLEGGKINSESDSFSSDVMEVDQQGPGLPGGDYGQILLQGLVLPEFHKIYVRHVTNCNSSDCVEDIISVRHCQSGKMVTYTGFHGGAGIVDMHIATTDPC